MINVIATRNTKDINTQVRIKKRAVWKECPPKSLKKKKDL